MVRCVRNQELRQLASTDLTVAKFKAKSTKYYRVSCGFLCQNVCEVIQNLLPLHGSSYFDTL